MASDATAGGGTTVHPGTMAQLAASVTESLLPRHTGSDHGWQMTAARTYACGDVVAVAYPYAMASPLLHTVPVARDASRTNKPY